MRNKVNNKERHRYAPSRITCDEQEIAGTLCRAFKCGQSVKFRELCL